MKVNYRGKSRYIKGYANIEDFLSCFYISCYSYYLLHNNQIVPNDCLLDEYEEVTLIPIRITKLIDDVLGLCSSDEHCNNVSIRTKPLTKCDLCLVNDAITYKGTYGGPKRILKKYFCTACFINSVEHAVFKAIDANHLINDGDQVLIPISGGKDSIAEAYFIHKYVHMKSISAQVEAYTVTMFNTDYEYNNVKNAVLFCQSNQIKHRIIDISKFMPIHKNYNCYICSSARRYVEKIFIEELQANKVSSGKNYSDKIRHKFFSTLLDTNLESFAPLSEIPDFCTVISPILNLRDYDTALFLKCLGIDYGRHYDEECPYADTSYRRMQTTITEAVNDNFPGLIDHKIQVSAQPVTLSAASYSREHPELNHSEMREYILRALNRV